jgi:hypothetical protein
VIFVPFVPPAVHTSGVVVVNVTGRPELAAALTTNGDAEIGLLGSAANEIVWLTNVDAPGLTLSPDTSFPTLNEPSSAPVLRSK